MSETKLKVADAPENSWVYRMLPEGFWPYAQLARWDRPIGWWLLMWPCWWSLMMAAASGQAMLTSDFSLLLKPGFFLVLFMLGAIAMRGAGCTYNDLVDKNIDGKVERTRSRPLPSGRVSKTRAMTFLIAQLLAGFFVLVQFNLFTFLLGVASLGVVAIYPFMKRITWWPQLFLGLAFSWGALMGWASLNGQLALAPVMLYLGSIFWVIGYDTIYAHQDIEDDALIGVKSTARLFGKKTGFALILLYGLTLVFYGLAFYFAELAWPAFFGLGLGVVHMIWQITSLNIKDPARCLFLFKSNSHFGWILFIGITASLFVN